MASGNGYNKHYNKLIADVPRKTDCVDDVCMWDLDESREDHWWQTIDNIILMGSNCVTLNSPKFQFSHMQNFPKPSNISNIRS